VTPKKSDFIKKSKTIGDFKIETEDINEVK